MYDSPGRESSGQYEGGKCNEREVRFGFSFFWLGCFLGRYTPYDTIVLTTVEGVKEVILTVTQFIASSGLTSQSRLVHSSRLTVTITGCQDERREDSTIVSRTGTTDRSRTICTVHCTVYQSLTYTNRSFGTTKHQTKRGIDFQRPFSLGLSEV